MSDYDDYDDIFGGGGPYGGEEFEPSPYYQPPQPTQQPSIPQEYEIVVANPFNGTSDSHTLDEWLDILIVQTTESLQSTRGSGEPYTLDELEGMSHKDIINDLARQGYWDMSPSIKDAEGNIIWESEDWVFFRESYESWHPSMAA